MAVVTIKWRGDEFRRLTQSQVRKGLAIAGINIANDVVQSISVKGFAGRHSRPGKPPFVQTNRLRASIASEQRGDVVRVGTNVEYAASLEVGTVSIAKRPFLRPALDRAGPTVKAALQRAATL